MSRQYCAYLSGIERQELIRDYTFEIESARIDLILEAIDKKQEIQMREAEIKVLAEGGTYSDLDMLYGEILNEASESTSKMSLGQRIAHLIDLLIDAFQSLLTGKSDFLADKKPTDTVKVDGEYNERMGIIKRILDPIRKLFDFIKGGIKNLLGATKEHPIVAAFLGVGAFLLVASNKDENATETKKVKEIEDDASMCVEALNMMNDLNKEIENAKKKIEEAEKEIAKKKAENQEIEKKESETNANNKYASQSIESMKQKKDEIKNQEIDRTGTNKLKKWSPEAAAEWTRLKKEIENAEAKKAKAEKELSENKLHEAANNADIEKAEKDKRDAEKTIKEAQEKQEQIKQEEEQRKDTEHKQQIQNNVDNSKIEVDENNNVKVNGKSVKAEVKDDVIYIDGSEFDDSEKTRNERKGMFAAISAMIHGILNFLNEQRKKVFAFLGKKVEQVNDIVKDTVQEKYNNRTGGDKDNSSDDEDDEEEDDWGDNSDLDGLSPRQKERIIKRRDKEKIRQNKANEKAVKKQEKADKKEEKRYMRRTYGNTRAD